MTNKIILVIGATGAQGGGVARHLLEDGKYKVRAITRNPDSDAAKALGDAGAEVVKGDLTDRASLDAALKDVWGVFGVTNFWEHFDKEKEHGITLADAVNNSDADFFVFSTLPHANKLSDDKYDVPHFYIKAEIEEYIRGLDVKSAFVSPAFYYENFLSFFPPQKFEDGVYGFGFPQGTTPLAAIGIEDLGGIVKTIFDSPDKYVGKVVGAVGEDYSASEYAKTMSNVLGKNIVYNHVPLETFAAYGFPGADDLANMFEFNRYYIPNRLNDLDESIKMYPKMKNFEAWLIDNKDKFDGIFKD